jgi:hypothetical protein
MTKAISSGVSSKLYTPINTISTSLSISSKRRVRWIEQKGLYP